MSLGGGLQRGDIVPFTLTSDLGCNRSGERARRSKGEPGSADFGLCALKAFLAELGVRLAPGLYV